MGWSAFLHGYVIEARGRLSTDVTRSYVYIEERVEELNQSTMCPGHDCIVTVMTR